MAGGGNGTFDGAGGGTENGAGRGTRSDRSGRKHGPGSSSTRGDSTRSVGARQGELLPDGKLYYRIGEVAKITAVKPHVLRYWETEFRWMAPPKSRSKQRLYRRKDIEMILVIKRLLYEERYTIAGARQQLRELGLAKALGIGGGVTHTDEAIARSGAVEADAAPSEVEPMRELRTGYRHIRAELQAIREML